MAWLLTLTGALIVIVGFTAQNVTIVFWTNAPISAYGILLLCGLSFATIFGLALLTFAFLTGDASALRVSDDPAERGLFVSPWREDGKGGSRATAAGASARRFQLTHLQILACVGFLNSLNGWLIVYASPSTRTPPLIQAVLQNAGVLFSVPFSKLMLGDRKRYCSSAPLGAALLILSSVGVSLAPSLIAASNGGDAGGTGSLSSASSIAWCLIYLAGLAPGAGYNVCQQLFFCRSGALEPTLTGREQARTTLRALFYSNVFQAVSYILCFWIDLLPWFGTSSSVSDLVTSTAFSLACSVVGPGVAQLVSSDSCPSSTPVWGWAFIAAYAFSYVGGAVLNRESATFNMLVLVVVTMTTAAFWLIPGTNPNPSSTPLWSVLTSLALSLLGTTLWKVWEHKTMPAEEQFEVALQEKEARTQGGWRRRLGTGQSFHGDDFDGGVAGLGGSGVEDPLLLGDDGLLGGGISGGMGGGGGGRSWGFGGAGGVSDAVRHLVAKHQQTAVAGGGGSLNSGGGGAGKQGKYARI
jgi:hypothetical protein